MDSLSVTEPIRLGGSFQGIFDGQSHVVYNLYSHEGLKSENKDNNNNLYRNGLFGKLSTMQLCKISALKMRIS